MPKRLGLTGWSHHSVIPSTYWLFTGPGPANGTYAGSQNSMRVIPFTPGRAGTLTGVAIHVTTVGSTGSVLRIGLYAHGTDHLPGSLIADFGTVAATTTGMKTITGLTQAMDADIYWLAVANQGATTPATVRAVAGTNFLIGQSAGTPADIIPCAYEYTGVSGALPSGPLSTPNATAVAAPSLLYRMT